MSLNRFKLGLVAAGVAALSIASSAHASTVYDAVGGFSGTNPSGVWTYAYYDTNGAFQKLDTYNTNIFGGLNAWQNSNGSCCGAGTNDNAALIGKNVSGSVLNYETISLPTSYLAMDPESNKSVDLIFTAPTAGSYHISYMFDGIDTQAGNNNASHGTDVLINGVAYPPSIFGIINKFGDSAGGTLDVKLGKGGTVDFQTLTGFTTFAYLSTGVQATITGPSTVPLPSSAPMLGAAILALGVAGFGMRRKSAA